MTDNPSTVSTTDLLHIDECCDLFEAALRKNSTARLLRFLASVETRLQPIALRELLRTEASVRHELDLTMMTVETYIDDLPEFEAVVLDFFQGR